MSQSSEQGAPERIWMNPRHAGLYAQPEHMRDPYDTTAYTRSDICGEQLRTAMQLAEQNAKENESLRAELRTDICAALVEALEGVKHMTLRDGTPCFCKHGFTQGKSEFGYYFEPSGDMVHGARCNAARTAIAQAREGK